MGKKWSKIKRGLQKSLRNAFIAVSLVGAATAYYAYEVEPNNTQITHYTMDTPDWPYEDLTFAVIADFHAGCPSVDLERIQLEVDRINALDVDYVLLLGDFQNDTQEDKYKYNGRYKIKNWAIVETSGTESPEDIAAVLAGLNKPAYGILGNHDNRISPNTPDSLLIETRLENSYKMREALENVLIVQR